MARLVFRTNPTPGGQKNSFPAIFVMRQMTAFLSTVSVSIRYNMDDRWKQDCEGGWNLKDALAQPKSEPLMSL